MIFAAGGLTPVERVSSNYTKRSADEDHLEKEFVIAVVDDEAALCEAVSNSLNPAGDRVQTFASAENFGRPKIGTAGAVWSSMRSFRTSGLELQRHLAANGHQVPAIFVTEDKDGQMVQALRGGALAFLRKPFEMVRPPWRETAARRRGYPEAVHRIAESRPL